MTPVRLPLAPGPAHDAGRAIVRLDPADMARAGLRPGEAVAVEGTRRTYARLLPAPQRAGKVSTDGATAANAGAQWGDLVDLRAVDLAPLSEVDLHCNDAISIEHLRASLHDMALCVGDSHHLSVGAGTETRPDVTVQVARVTPQGAGTVGPQTQIRLQVPAQAPARYAGVAGLQPQIDAVHEMVELPLERPDLFERLGLAPPRGVLFTGPPGSGKTLLARALADRTQSSFFSIAGPELVSKHYGETERALREVFDAAARQAPSIVFIDEIDAIAPKRESLSGEKQVERRVVGQLLTLLDGLESRDRVVIIAATNLPDALDPALRRPGRFEREIGFGAPDPAARREILALHLARAPLAPDADLRAVAERCTGYLGADLASVAREAGLAALARARRETGDLRQLRAEDVFLTRADLDTAVGRTRPSLLRGEAHDAAPPSWSDVGGLDQVKNALTEAVIWPLQRSHAQASMRLTPPKGILLTGAPGAGKTLLARALATEADMNFMPVRASAILSQFLGEAEREVAALFQRARTTAPALLFFDELDTLAPTRGRADAASDRIIAQLLTELDGLEPNHNIVVVAATNRPDAIDPAITRPGRFDRVIELGLPDTAARAQILSVHLRGRAVAPEVDLEAAAQATPGASPADLAAIASEAARQGFARWRMEGEAGTPQIERDDLDVAARAWAAGKVNDDGVPNAARSGASPGAPPGPEAPD
ncbi:MAG: AAA family ATPase [Pseudomonadota bacterium]